MKVEVRLSEVEHPIALQVLFALSVSSYKELTTLREKTMCGNYENNCTCCFNAPSNLSLSTGSITICPSDC